MNTMGMGSILWLAIRKVVLYLPHKSDVNPTLKIDEPLALSLCLKPIKMQFSKRAFKQLKFS